LECFKSSKAALLPDKLSQAIMDSGTREALTEDIARNQQYTALRINKEVGHINRKLAQKFENNEIAASGEVIRKVPILTASDVQQPAKFIEDPRNNGN
jgi:hypothetical protein